MRMVWAGIALGLAAVVGVACGGSEDATIEGYFAALSAGDDRSLDSFAAVKLEEKVDAWSRVGSPEDSKLPVTLPDLAKRYEERTAELDAQKERVSRYSLERLSDVSAVRKLLEAEKKIPARLEEVAATWKELTDEQAELQAAADEARKAMEAERRLCVLSAGQADDLATAQGEILVKQVELSLTIDGQPKPYVMTLRRYMLEKGETPRGISQWIVQDLQPKG